MAIELGNASDKLVCVVEAFIARMTELLMPQKLFCPSSDGMCRDSFVHDWLQTTNVCSFELVGGIAERLIELTMLSGLGARDFSTICMFASIDEQCVFSSREVE